MQAGSSRCPHSDSGCTAAGPGGLPTVQNAIPYAKGDFSNASHLQVYIFINIKAIYENLSEIPHPTLPNQEKKKWLVRSHTYLWVQKPWPLPLDTHYLAVT